MLATTSKGAPQLDQQHQGGVMIPEEVQTDDCNCSAFFDATCLFEQTVVLEVPRNSSPPQCERNGEL